MLNLSNVTLISVCGDSNYLDGIIKAAKICTKDINFGDVKILSDKYITSSIYEIIKIQSLNKQQYCEFMMYELSKYIHTDYCLTFQGDGFVINPHLWKDDFLNYDYIGAPWLNENKNNVGNGGFSLRSKKFLLAAETLEYNSNIQFQPHIPAGDLITPEDWFMCNYSFDKMVDMGITFADVDTAYKFSVEHPSIRKYYDRNNLRSYNSFGFHGSFNVAAMNLLENI